MRDFKEFIEKYKKVPYKNVSSYDLCTLYGKDFVLWFDKNLFDWKYSNYLCHYCSDHFDTWFDKNLFDWKYSYHLCKHCFEHFYKWFDKDKFDWNCSYSLFEYCSEYLTNEILWECREKIVWKFVREKYLNNYIKMKLKIAGYL